MQITWATQCIATKVHFANQNGEPITKARVYIGFDKASRQQYLDLRSNRQGEVQFDAKGAPTFQVTVVGHIPCHEVGVAAVDYSVDEILRTGFATHNNCGRGIAEPQRGRLTYFVRPATWWEMFKN